MPNRDVVSLNLESARACKGDPGSIVGRLYYVDLGGRRLKVSRQALKLGAYNPDLEDDAWLLRRAREEEAKLTRQEVPLENCVGLGALRICLKKRHDDAPRVSDGSGHRVERFRSLAVVRDLNAYEQLRPLNSKELAKAAQNQGVTETRRHNYHELEGTVTSVLLPLTEAEDKKYVGASLRAMLGAGVVRALGSQPHIIVHPEGEGHIEHIATPEQLM